MAVLTQGQTATLALVTADSVTIEAGQNVASVEYPVGTKIFEGGGSRTFGPYSGGSLKVTATTGSVEYEFADGSAPVAAILGTPSDQVAFQAMVSGGGNDDALCELDPVGYLPYSIVESDGTYLYGYTGRTAYRTLAASPSANLPTLGAAVPGSGTLTVIASTPMSGLVFISTRNLTTGSDDIYRSTDGGATWSASPVFECGSYNITLGYAQRTPNSRVLSPKSIAYWTAPSGAQALYFAEYAVPNTRVAGAENDSISVWRSVDLGLTWQRLWSWNTNGTNQTTHCHSIQVDPYTNKLWIATGDANSGSGVLEWDGATLLPDNTALATIAAGAISGWRGVYGSQALRAPMLTITADELVYLADAFNYGALSSQGSSDIIDTGMMAINKTTLKLRRIADSISSISARLAFHGVKTNTGEVVFLESDEHTGGVRPAGQSYFRVHATNKGMTQAGAVGLIRINTSQTPKYPTGLCVAGGNIYIDVSTSYGGKANTLGRSTVVVQMSSRPWCGIRPDTLHPVYWIDDVSGIDSTTGMQGQVPNLPFRTLTYALTGSRVTNGSRIQMPSRAVTAAADEHPSGAACRPVFSVTNADILDFVSIHGAGRQVSSWTPVVQASGSALFEMNYTNHSVEFKDIFIEPANGSPNRRMFNYNAGTTTNVFRAIRANLGAATDFRQAVFSLRGTSGKITVLLHDSVVRSRGGNQDVIELPVGAEGGAVEFRADNNSALIFGGFGAYATANTTISVKNSVMINGSFPMFTVNSGAARLPEIFNCRIIDHGRTGTIAGTHALTADKYMQCSSDQQPVNAALFDASFVVDTTGRLIASPQSNDWSDGR